MAKRSGTGGGVVKILLGFVLAVVVLAAGMAAYLRWGSLPVAGRGQAVPV